MPMIVADNCFPECELELAIIDDLQLLVEEEMYKRKKTYCGDIYKSIANSRIRELLEDLFGNNCDKIEWDDYHGITARNNGSFYRIFNFYPLLKSNTDRL